MHWSRDEDANAEQVKYAPKPEHKGVLIPEFVDSIHSGSNKAGARREFDLMSIVLAADESLKYDHPINIEYIS